MDIPGGRVVMVGITPALLEGACWVAIPLVIFPRKRSRPPPLRLEGEAEKAEGSATADVFPIADAVPRDSPDVGLTCEIGVTCRMGVATSPFVSGDEANEAA